MSYYFWWEDIIETDSSDAFLVPCWFCHAKQNQRCKYNYKELEATYPQLYAFHRARMDALKEYNDHSH